MIELRFVKHWVDFHGEKLPHLVLQHLVAVKRDSSYGSVLEWRNIPVVDERDLPTNNRTEKAE